MLPLVVLVAGATLGAGMVVRHRESVAVASAHQHRRRVAPAFQITLLDVPPGSGVPLTPEPVPTDLPGPDDPRTVWVDRVSANSDIPRRVLTAYVDAESIIAVQRPGCHLSWNTLAGVGWIESRHGRFHGASVTADGRETHPIIGPALDGSPGVQRIKDTDHGRLDGDPVWDHAVGPMQFLPTRWATLGVRASGDGHAPDPQNIDDAAVTAGEYLCDSGGDLATPAGWWAAEFAYNNSTRYGQRVYSAAVAYAHAAVPTE